jgi:Ca2+-transporting ATPase
MWFTIIFIGAVSAACTLGVLDASLPGGFIEGSGSMRYAQTMAFTTLVFCSLFSAFSARSDERSALQGLFTNLWLWAAVALAVVLQALVVYVPFLQRAFSTVSLSAADWLRCVIVASLVLWSLEVLKAVIRR